MSLWLAASPAAAECVFAKLGEMSVDVSHGAPRVEIEANGQKRWVLLVTGSQSSALRKNDAAALGGTSPQEAGVMRMTPKGERRLTYTTLRDVVVGGKFTIKTLPVLISDDETMGEVAGYLGSDILAASDVEFDLANGRIAFFKPEGCAKQNLGYWGGVISETPMVNVAASNQSLVLANVAFRPKITLNGRPVTAELNSSFASSVVDLQTAAALGLGPGAAGVKNIETGGQRPTYVAQFAEFAIGEEKIKNPSFVLRDMWSGLGFNQTGSLVRARPDGLPGMILGLDFMRSHRVLVANSQRKIYLSYSGGRVFSAPPDAR